MYVATRSYEYHLKCKDVENHVALVSIYCCTHLSRMNVDYVCRYEFLDLSIIVMVRRYALMTDANL